MSFGDDLAEATEELRSLALERMTSVARVHRLDPERIGQDADTGRENATYDLVYDDLPWRTARSGVGQSRTEPLGESEVQVGYRTGVCPHTTRLRADDLVEVYLGEHAPVVWRVVNGAGADSQIEVRVVVEEVARPSEWG